MNTIVNQVASNNPKPMSFDKKSKPKVVKKTSTTKSLNTKKSLLRKEVTSKLKKRSKRKKQSNRKNRSLVGEMPKVDVSSGEIKMSKKGLRKVLKALFSDMGLSDNEMLKLLKDLGKDEQSVQNLTKFINKTKENDLKKKTDIIRNMNQLKDSILNIYKLFDELNNNLGILFERKKPQ